MIKIQADQTHKILRLFDFDFPNQTAFLACARSTIPGKFYIDNPVTPKACLSVIGFYNWAFIGGTPDQAWLDQVICISEENKTFNTDLGKLDQDRSDPTSRSHSRH
jgi:hypothetical protein